MALSTDDCTQQQQVFSTDCMNPTFFARRKQLSSSSPPTPPLPKPPPLFPLTPAENVESLPPHHDNESFDDSPPTLLSHQPLRGGYHHYHQFTTGGIQGYPSPPSASANHSTTATNLDDTPYDLFYDYPYPHLKHPTAALFEGYHVAGFPSRIDTIMTSTPSSMAVSTPSLSPSSPLSVFNDQQSPPPPPYPASAPGSVRVRRGNGLELSSEEDADALLSPLSPEWGTTALTATNNTTTTAAAARHGILGLPTHTRNIEQPHHLQTSTLLPPPSSLSPLLSPSEPLGDFDELLVPMGRDRGGSRYDDQPDDLWDNVGEDDDDDGFPPFLNLSTFDAAHDDLLSASTSAFTSRPILPFLDIPPPRSGTTTATRSRATSRSRSRSPFWEYPPLPRSSTSSVAGVRDYGDGDDEDADVNRVGEGDAEMSLDGQGEDREFIVSPPSSGPPDTPSTPTDLPALPFLDLFDDDEDEDLIPPRSPKGKTRHDTNEDVISIPGYFPHPTSPSIPVHRSILPPYEQEGQDRDFGQQLQFRDSPPRSGPERPHTRKEEDGHHHPPSPSPPLLSLSPPFASFSPLTSPPLLPHASPRPALLQLSFDDEGEFGLEGSSGAASPPFSPDNNSLRLLLHNSPPRSPPHPSSTLPSTTRSPSPEFYYDNVLTDIGVGQSGEYAEEVKKLVELQKRAREAERVAREREGLVMAALQARRGARLAGSISPDSTPASDEATASLPESPSTITEDEKKTENEEVAFLQRAAAEARSVAKRERERAKEVGMLLKLKLGEVSDERESDTRMDTDDTTTTTTIGNAQDTETSVPHPMLSSTTSPSPGSISTQPFLSGPTSSPPTPTTTMKTIPTKTGHPRMASIAQLVAKMFLSRHEASSSSASTSISTPALPPPPTAISPSSTTTEATTTSSSSAPSLTSTSSGPVTSMLRSSSSASPSSSSSKYRNLWLKGLAGSNMLGRLGGTGIGADRFLQSQLQQRYKFLRSSPLARNESSINDEEDDDGPNCGDERDREERDDGVDGGFEALRRPIMWGMDLDEDEGVGLLPAL